MPHLYNGSMVQSLGQDHLPKQPWPIAEGVTEKCYIPEYFYIQPRDGFLGETTENQAMALKQALIFFFYMF